MSSEPNTPEGKGRPTPSRRDAEAARRKSMKTPMTRKEQLKAQRARQIEARKKMRAGMDQGDERFMTARDAGPVRRFARDYIDRRLGFAEFLLPLLVVILILSVISHPVAQQASITLWIATILATVADEVFLIFGLKRQAKRRFPEESLRGLTFYAVLRSSQMRMIRVPKPQVARGQELPERYS